MPDTVKMQRRFSKPLRKLYSHLTAWISYFIKINNYVFLYKMKCSALQRKNMEGEISKQEGDTLMLPILTLELLP